MGFINLFLIPLVTSTIMIKPATELVTDGNYKKKKWQILFFLTVKLNFAYFYLPFKPKRFFFERSVFGKSGTIGMFNMVTDILMKLSSWRANIHWCYIFKSITFITFSDLW